MLIVGGIIYCLFHRLMCRNLGEQLDGTEHDVSTAVGDNSSDGSDDDGGADRLRFTESSGEGPELEAWMSTKNKRTAGGDERSDAEAEDGEQSDDGNSTATGPTPGGIC